MTTSTASGSFLGTFGFVFLAIAALFAADTFLAKTERAERLIEAKRLFEQGQRLMHGGKNDEAIDSFKDALGMERDNRDYRAALARAELAAGKAADAQTTLTELLQSNSTDGLANLLMARVLLKENRFDEAVSYFHRAIYGHWNEDAAGNRLKVRFELIKLLAQRNSKQELLAELLSVQDQAPGDLMTQTRIGHLFLAAGSPGRAAEVFREILGDAPTDADAYTGLAEAEFAQGNYRAAQKDFLAALRLKPGDEAVRQTLDVCTEVLMLDPTIRGLGPAERFRRSLRLLELTVDDTSQCIGATTKQEPQLLDRARQTLTEHVRVSQEVEASEANLDLAEQLWQTRKQVCTIAPAPRDPLALVLAKVAQ